MKAKLDQKVDRMRSQTMSFSNEGMEISLSIPDTQDVKDAFGSVIETVVEQEGEIVGLGSNIRHVVEDTVSAQNTILDWTKQCVLQLHEQNLQLQSKLQEAQREIKNFAYNIQGYVDPVKESDFLPADFDLADAAPAFTVPHAAQASPVKAPQEEGAMLFRTEDGANPEEGSDYMTVRTDAKKDIKTKREAKQAKPPRKTNEEKLAAKVMYFAVKPVKFPPAVRERWAWAIKKVIAANRLKGLQLPLNKTRVAKGQTLVDRLSRMDADLYQLPITLERLMKEQAEELQSRLEAEVQTIERKLAAIDEATEARNKAVDERMAGIDGSISAMGQRMDALIEEIQKKGKEDTQKIFDNLAAIETHLSEVLGLDFTQFRGGLEGLKKQVKETAVKGEMLHVEISAMIKASDEEDTTDPSKLLVAQLKQDIQMRNSRAAVALLESEFDMATGSHQAITAHIERYAAHYTKAASANNQQYLPGKANEKLEELGGLASAVESFIQQGRALVRNIKKELNDHDASLSEKHNVLNNTFATVQGLKTVNENMLILRNEVADIKALADAANDAMSTAQSAESERLDKAMDKISNRVAFVEDSVTKLAKEGAEQRRPKSRGSQDPVPVPINPADLGELGDLEAKLVPLVSKIVEVAMQGRARTPGGLTRQNTMMTRRSVATDGGEGGGEGRERRRRKKKERDPNASASFDPNTSLPAEPGVAPEDANGESMPLSARPKSALRRGSTAADLMIVGEAASQTPRPLSAKPAPLTRSNTAKSSRENSASLKRALSRSKSNLSVHDIVDEGGARLTEELQPEVSQLEGGDDDEDEMDDEYLYDEQDYEEEFGDDLSQPGQLNGSFAEYDMGGGNSALLADMSILRKDSAALHKKLEDIANHRLTHAQADVLVRQIMREERRLTQEKTPTAMAQEDIDKSIREIISELIQQKKMHDYDINSLRSQFDAALVHAMNVAMNDLQDQTKQSVITTKALCLGCGRPSLVAGQTDRPRSPSFLPSIYANETPGPDILRGGFKLPVGSHSPPRDVPKKRTFSLEMLHSQASGRDLVNLPPLGEEGGLEGAGGQSNVWHDLPQQSNSFASDDEEARAAAMMQQRVGFEIDSDSLPASTTAAFPLQMAGSTAPLRESSAARAIRHAQGRPESEQLRPIYRKGFPGKKSARAETSFAPERFDLPGSKEAVLRVSRITNVLADAKHPAGGPHVNPQTHKMYSASTSALM